MCAIALNRPRFYAVLYRPTMSLCEDDGFILAYATLEEALESIEDDGPDYGVIPATPDVTMTHEQAIAAYFEAKGRPSPPQVHSMATRNMVEPLAPRATRPQGVKMYSFTRAKGTVVVYYSKYLDEYTCRFVGNPEADYFTDDYDDMIATALVMAGEPDTFAMEANPFAPD